jgi:hypothetical protein
MSLALSIPPFKVSLYWRPTEGDDWDGDGELIAFGSSGELQADTRVTTKNDTVIITFIVYPSLLSIVPIGSSQVNKNAGIKASPLTETIEPDRLTPLFSIAT